MDPVLPIKGSSINTQHNNNIRRQRPNGTHTQIHKHTRTFKQWYTTQFSRVGHTHHIHYLNLPSHWMWLIAINGISIFEWIMIKLCFFTLLCFGLCLSVRSSSVRHNFGIQQRTCDFAY